MNNQNKIEETFCVDDLLSELQTEVKQKLQNAGKSDVDVDILTYTDKYVCHIRADRKLLRQVFVLLLDDAVKSIESGLIIFGYFVMDTNLVDFFVDDTRITTCGNTAHDLSPVRNLLKPIGSRLKKSTIGMGCSLRFSIKSEHIAMNLVQETKLA